MSKRPKQLTKRERKAAEGNVRTVTPGAAPAHIHCIACGRHIDPREFEAPASAKLLKCLHGKTFPSCVGCEASSTTILDEHDRTNREVRPASAWH